MRMRMRVTQNWMPVTHQRWAREPPSPYHPNLTLPPNPYPATQPSPCHPTLTLPPNPHPATQPSPYHLALTQNWMPVTTKKRHDRPNTVVI